jgi:hypothetical protein
MGKMKSKPKRRLIFERQEIDENFQLPTLRSAAKKENDDVASGSRRPLAAEIGIPPFETTKKELIISKCLKTDGKFHRNTTRKLWSL